MMDAEHMEKEQRNKIMNGLNNLRKNKAMTDVNLKAKDGTIDAHKLILSVSSPYFNSLFNTGSKEAVNEVDVEGIKVNVLETILDYIYTGFLPEDLQNDIGKVQELIVASDFLQMQELQDYCWEILLQNLKVDNYMEPLIFAENYANEDALNEIYKYIKENFDEINDDGQLVELSPKQMQELMSLVKDDQPSRKLLETILKWAKHDPETRKPELNALFQVVDFDELPDEVIRDLSTNEPLLKDSVLFLQKLLSIATSRLMTKTSEIPSPSSVSSHGSRYEVKCKSTASPSKNASTVEGTSCKSSRTKTCDDPMRESSRTGSTILSETSSSKPGSTILSETSSSKPSVTKSPMGISHRTQSPSPVEDLSRMCSPSKLSPPRSPKNAVALSPSPSTVTETAEYDSAPNVVYHKLHFFRYSEECPQKVKIQSYMPCNRSWFPEATLPDIISPDFIVCSVGCCLYFLSSYYQCVILYYPTNGRFKQLTTSCPIGNCVRVVEHRNKIYIWSEECFIRFNPGLKKWESLAPYHGDFTNCFFISTSSALFIRNCAEKALYCYNTFANQWYMKTVHQNINCNASCAAYEEKLYFCNVENIQIYDPAANKWEWLKLPEEMSEMGSNWSHLSVSQEWPFLLFQDGKENLWQFTPFTKVLEKFADPYDRDISDWNRCVLTVEVCKSNEHV